MTARLPPGHPDPLRRRDPSTAAACEEPVGRARRRRGSDSARCLPRTMGSHMYEYNAQVKIDVSERVVVRRGIPAADPDRGRRRARDVASLGGSSATDGIGRDPPLRDEWSWGGGEAPQPIGLGRRPAGEDDVSPRHRSEARVGCAVGRWSGRPVAGGSNRGRRRRRGAGSGRPMGGGPVVSGHRPIRAKEPLSYLYVDISIRRFRPPTRTFRCRPRRPSR